MRRPGEHAACEHATCEHAAWRGGVVGMTARGGAILFCLALLIASAFFNSSASLADGVWHAEDCSVPRTDSCERKGKSGPSKRAAPKREDVQRARVTSAVANLAPQRKDITDLSTIGVARWADQDVFLKEVDGAIGSRAKGGPR